MEENERSNKEIIGQINNLISQQLWMDFELNQYDGTNLIIGGSVDLSHSQYYIKISFKEVNFICLNTEWNSDTSNNVLLEIDQIERKELVRAYNIENGYSIFKFVSENDDLLLVAAKLITFSTDNGALKAPRK